MKNTDNKIFEDGYQLPLIDQFYTIQGEGYHMGKAAYFIRIGGCDIGCSWCDTKISWKIDVHSLTDINIIVKNAFENRADTVVVTGGEPSLYNLAPLCNALNKKGIDAYIETSGAHPLKGKWDWICLSPKRQNPPQEEIFAKANELKVIISSSDDLEWAEENAAKVNKDCKLYLQPEWSNYQQLIIDIVEYVKINKKWQVSLQAHKFMHIP